MVRDVLLGGLFIAGTVGTLFFAYFLMRRLLGAEPAVATKDLAASVVFRIAGLHALILALIFAQEMVDYQQIRLEGASEASALADIYFDAERYGAATKPAIQQAVAEYLRLVIAEEWPSLAAEGRLSQAAWDEWDVAYQAILDLEPENKRQESLREHMLERIHTISEARNERENHGGTSLGGMFWFAAVSGVVLIALAYYPYPLHWHNLLLIGMFGAFTGIVLFLIYAFSNPYGPPGELLPTPFERVAEQLAGAAVD